MNNFLFKVLDWSEIWALLFPLAVLQFRRQQDRQMKPVILYIWLGFLINIVIDTIMAINMYFPNDYLSNNLFYNLHSVIRFACFSFYFIQLQPNSFRRLKKTLALGSILFLVFNFVFFEDFFNYNSLSGNLLATEAYLLLVYCMLYYLTELKNDRDGIFDTPHFWIVTGLGIYVVINFFVFLFYLPLIDVDIRLAVNFWNVHNIAFIIFCLFLTKAFYGSVGNKYSV